MIKINIVKPHTMNTLPDDLVNTITRSLGRQNAARAAGASRQLRQSVKRTHADLPAGPRAYRAGTGRRQKEYKRLKKDIARAEDRVLSCLEGGQTTAAKAHARLAALDHISIATSLLKSAVTRGDEVATVASFRDVPFLKPVWKETLAHLAREIKQKNRRAAKKLAVAALKKKTKKTKKTKNGVTADGVTADVVDAVVLAMHEMVLRP